MPGLAGELAYFVHESSYVDEPAVIGDGTKIWHFSHVMAGSEIGRDCTIGQNVTIGPRARIGNRVKIQNNVSVYEGVELGDEVFCGPSMVFTNVYNPRAAVTRKDEYRRTLVRHNATIGANATIVCGRFGMNAATRSPGLTPIAHSVAASVPTWRSSSAQASSTWSPFAPRAQ